ncbi:LAMI_0A06040g1_1 [Lachancea mirantina]|uniref:LAMI_0A06040g1_1 n=1 Tax=Lachancea mirantina TaxID=1230905 RepID=A0A1G4IPX0_9SACH|nr:LAMI_0A06040g1_1 [Lachancea mirantina]
MTQTPKRPKRSPSYLANASFNVKLHPLGVKPAGNALFDNDIGVLRKSRERSLGKLANLEESTLMRIIELLDTPSDLKTFGHVSKFLYAYTYDEELWRNIYVKEFQRIEESQISSRRPAPYGCDKWRGSWRKTLLKLNSEAHITVKNQLYSDVLFRPYQCSQVNYELLFKNVIDVESKSSQLCSNVNLDFGIERFDEDSLTNAEFESRLINKPFILKSSKTARWPAWDISDLVGRYGDVEFRQEAIKWDLKTYADYFKCNRDESPLYLFDCNSPAIKKIKTEYKAPKLFQKDLFHLFQEGEVKCRPDHRWLIVGPAGSGSTFHKDPNYTSAWNTVLCGMKLWVMLPPHVKPPGVSTDKSEEEVTCPVGVAEWVISGYYNDTVKLAQQGDCVIGVTFPGECIYVPSGWWHMVINITDSVALTENFVPPAILPRVLHFFKNRQAQLSGFHLRDVVESLNAFLKNATSLDISVENLSKLRNLSKQAQNERLENSDCGLSSNSCKSFPLYEFFVELIRNSKYAQYLQDAVLECVKIETEERQQREKTVKRSETWDDLVSEQNNGFSFAFGVEE